MRQKTFFDEAEPVAVVAPIARRSDPVTSHKAAAKTEKVVKITRLQCLMVLKEFGKPMTSNELAAACCDRFCDELKSDPKKYANKLSNYRKRADEIKRDKDLCVKLEEERNGCQLFKAK